MLIHVTKNLLMFIFLLFSCEVVLNKEMIQNGDLKVKGKYETEELIIRNKKEIEIERMKLSELKLKQLTTKETKLNVLITDKLETKNEDGNLYINGLLKIKGNVTYKNNPNESSFLELNNIYIDGIKQWKNIKYYSEKNSLKILNRKINEEICKNKKNEMELELNLVNEDKANHYKIEMIFKFKNKYWNKNIVYIKYNDEYYWNDNHNWDEITEEDENDESYWQSPITFIIPGRLVNNEKIKLIFGYKINKLSKEFCNKNILAFKFSDLNISIK